MVVYSLGMTFYWCIDYHLPHNQVLFSFYWSLAETFTLVFVVRVMTHLFLVTLCPCSRSI